MVVLCFCVSSCTLYNDGRHRIYLEVEGGTINIGPGSIWRTDGTRIYRMVVPGAPIGPLPVPVRASGFGADVEGFHAEIEGFSNFFGRWLSRFTGQNVTDDTPATRNDTLTYTWEDGPANLERGNETFLYRLRFGNQYMGANMRLHTGRDDRYAIDLWRIEPVAGTLNYYTMESLSFAHSDRRNRNMLTGGVELTPPSLRAYDGSHAQQWSIRRVGAGAGATYYFSNRQNPNLMIGRGVSPLVNLTTNQAVSGWQLVRCDRRASYFGGRHQTAPRPGDMAALSIGITGSALMHGMTSYNVFVYGHAWNDISSRVNVTVFGVGERNIYPGHRDWPNPAALGVIVRSHNFFTEAQGGRTQDHFGMFVPNGLTVFEADSAVNQEWRWGTILLCMRAENLGRLSREEQRALFIHEVGHALKLAHPQEFHGRDWLPASNMNANYFNSFVVVTGYDRFNLIRAWGR